MPAYEGSLFAPPAPLINDAEQLEKTLHAAETAASPEELRKLWAGGSAR